MADSHTFEYTEYDPETGEEISTVKVHYERAIVRTAMEKRRLISKLLDAYGYLDELDGHILQDELDNITEYCSAMAQCKTSAAWWTNSNASLEEVRDAYELFLKQDITLHRLFQTASAAVTIPKKTLVSA